MVPPHSLQFLQVGEPWLCAGVSWHQNVPETIWSLAEKDARQEISGC